MNLLEIFKKLLKHFGKQHWWPSKSKDETIIGAILTQNTSWKNVEKSLQNLSEQNLLSLVAIAKYDNLEEIIKPSGFYRQKAKYLKEAAKRIDMEKFGTLSTKELRKRLLKIKGIGKETADSIILYAFERPVFVIDAYTKRIFSRLGLLDKNLSYDEFQDYFMKNLPSDVYIYNEFHALIVKLAKEFCSKKNTDCKNCPLREVCKQGREI